ncbi:hypothetical protein PGQ11_003060 [Apiospora arundinis]|uniref:Uncharacterized protein n=1 Tax=Apiospora arundinis TaxID=335852 RepID=A0ABR2J4T6_9PEZI
MGWGWDGAASRNVIRRSGSDDRFHFGRKEPLVYRRLGTVTLGEYEVALLGIASEIELLESPGLRWSLLDSTGVFKMGGGQLQ